jgi:hypothetical protein
MSEHDQSEDLVQVHHARDECEGNIVVGFLRENGIEATLQCAPYMPPLDLAENLTGSNKINGVFVLEHEAEHARRLLQEFAQARQPADDSNETDLQH